MLWLTGVFKWIGYSLPHSLDTRRAVFFFSPLFFQVINIMNIMALALSREAQRLEYPRCSSPIARLMPCNFA